MDVRWDAREQQVEGGLGVNPAQVTREEVFEDLGTGMAGSQGAWRGGRAGGVILGNLRPVGWAARVTSVFLVWVT